MVLTRESTCFHSPLDAAGSLLNLLRQSGSLSVELETDVLRGVPGLAVIADAYAAFDESREGTNVVREVSGRELSRRHKKTLKRLHFSM